MSNDKVTITVPPSVAEFAVEERQRLLDRIEELERDLSRRIEFTQQLAKDAAKLDDEIAALKARPRCAILPERSYECGSDVELTYEAEAHNRCLDEVARLNSSPVSAGEHSTQENYDHFLSYSGLTDQPMLRYAYFHGADEHCEQPKITGAVDERAEAVTFESAFPGYKAMVGDAKASRAVGNRVEQPSNMFRVWLHCRAALTASVPNHSEQVREWIPVSERLPETKPGTDVDFIVAIRRAHNGKTYVVPASFLNSFELYSEDDAADDEGRIYVTGWYREMADDEYDTAWHKMETGGDVITDWQPLPAAPSAGSQGGDV